MDTTRASAPVGESGQAHVSLKQAERRWQDAQGGALQQHAYGRPGTRVVLDGQFRRIAAALKLTPGMRLLDLGCGVGHLLRWLAAKADGMYHGLDLSLTSLASAKEAEPTLRLAAGDAEMLPYKDGSFDRISCNGSAHHLLDECAAFREMYRVLAPGGILVLHEPTSTPLTSALRRLLLRTNRYESPADLAHKEEFTPARVRVFLAEAGFTDISPSFHDFLAYPLSGNYLASPFARSQSFMRLAWRVETALAQCSFLKPLLDLFAWRLLVVSVKPKGR